ncbi:hypothetical protein EVAR_92356_1 [Eumeta japonica]|uniref:Uncharacterized protein n=1 Tax=Eumeta variegata TaxID=151549 RepID=A0A4C1TIM9_EUMVA|nr:hypothetical protein EVAR_92356_1 [Eumeta japonica]
MISVSFKAVRKNGCTVIAPPPERSTRNRGRREAKSARRPNQEEWDTLAQNKMEMKKAADELYQLPETDTESSAPSEENEE